jgi:hypothetical protein
MTKKKLGAARNIALTGALGLASITGACSDASGGFVQEYQAKENTQIDELTKKLTAELKAAGSKQAPEVFLEATRRALYDLIATYVNSTPNGKAASNQSYNNQARAMKRVFDSQPSDVQWKITSKLREYQRGIGNPFEESTLAEIAALRVKEHIGDASVQLEKERLAGDRDFYSDIQRAAYNTVGMLSDFLATSPEVSR